MAPTISRSRLLIILLCVVIVIMMVQNYFLVRKNDEYQKRVEILAEEVNRLSVMSKGDTVYAFSALNMDSSSVIIDPDGKKKLIFVLTTTCGSCVQNMAGWNQLRKDISQFDVQVIGISPDSIYKIRSFSGKVYPSFPVFSLASNYLVARKYKFQTFPQTILVDESGIVQGVWVGILNDEQRNNIIESLRAVLINNQN